MLRRWLVALAVLSIAPVGLSLSSVAGSSVLRADRYIVVLKDSAPATAVAARATILGGTLDSLFGLRSTRWWCRCRPVTPPASPQDPRVGPM